MSTTIDEKVVEMRFENKQFESNVANSISTLDKLKRSLNLTGASKGLAEVDAAAKRVDMGSLGSAIETVQAKFSSLQVMGVTALSNITNQAVNAGKRMVSALTVDPIKTGFNEYETKINSIQTIMSNTASKGTTMEDVTRVIGELNTYADKTIYNFAEMTRNIGTFTAAGVGLEESASAIQGIANLAAASGSSSQQASTAMYQLSQALAAGQVKLMDWNSVVNAGMGGEKFQNALKATARDHGVAVDDIIKKNGSFRESLQEGWITADILNETLSKFTIDGAKKYAKSMVESGKWTQKQADALIKEAKSMDEAATKVKTFTQLWDTLKESAQSGWSQSWEIVVGDFEEAKVFLTEISDTIGGILGKSADSRNKLLQGWKDMGGRTDLIDSLRNAFEAVETVIKPIKEAFREIFPPATAKQLYNITAGIKSFTEKLKISGDTADKIKRTFKGLFSIVDIFKKIITSVAKAIGSLFKSGGITSFADLILSMTASIGDFFTSINDGFKADGFTGALTKIASTISKVIGKTSDGLKGFGSVLVSIGEALAKAFGYIWDKVVSVFTWISDNVSAGDIFAGLAGGGVFLTAKKIIGLVDKVKDTIDDLFGKNNVFEKALELGDKFGEVLGSVKESLSAFTTGIKVASLVSIAVAVALLSSSLTKISKLKAVDIGKSLLAMGIMFTMLTQSFKSITKALNAFPSKGIVKAGIATMLMAKAIDILADAIVEMSGLSFPQIAKGLIAVGGGLFALTKGVKAINGVKIPISTSLALLALAKSCDILGDALKKFGKMAWDEIGRGLVAMGGALTEFVAAVSVLNKFGGFNSLLGSASIFIAVQSLDEMSENLKKFGKMAWNEIGRGLSAMGGALTELGTVLSIVGKISGFSSVFAATSLVIAVQSLDPLVVALKKFGSMSWDEIKRGLTSMGGALTELGLVIGLLGKITGFSGILGAGAILIGVQALDEIAVALKKFGSMAWDEIGRGLTAMGGALTELGVVFGLLGYLTGFGGILGAGAILVGVQGLDKLANALQKFGSMTWDEIKRGLVGMGGALTELGVVSGLLGFLNPFGALVGSGSLVLAIQGLDDLANALIKFGSMSWDEVKTGLAAMGGALGELALGGFLNTLSIIGSYSISEMAEPLGVLADSVKKWSGVSVPENLGLQLASLARGIMAFTFGGLGASALAISAPAVGTMADSVKKWSGVTIPEGLVGNLSTLADGIKKFTFGGMGASTLSTAAAPLGTMADSVKKWSSVTIPKNLGSQLSSLADAIKSFSWAFMGGWSLSAVAGPLGELAGDIKKWKDVSMPENLPKQLKSLSDAIKSFSWAFMGGWSLSAISGPLGQLAGDIKKWNGVSLPSNLTKQLKSLASAVKEFSWAFMGGWSLSAVTGPLGKLAGSVKKWNGVTIPSGLGKQLKSLAGGVKAFSGATDISTATSGLKSIASSVTKLNGVNFKTISSGLTTFSTSLKTFASSSGSLSGVGSKIVNNIVTPIKKASSQLSGAGGNLISSLAKGINSKSGSVTSAIKNIITKMVNAVNSKKSQFNSAGSKLGSQLASGIKKSSPKAKSAVSSLLRSAIGGINNYYDNFVSAGKSLANGFAAGISANSFKAAAKAAAMANAAEKAAKEALDINSPSKVFRALGYSVPEGFAMGIDRMRKMVISSSVGMTDAAVTRVSSSISRIADMVNGNIDAQPTIRPVLDLSNVREGASSINGMLSGRATLSVGTQTAGSIATSMSNRQNGNSNEIVSAIKDLRKDFANMPRNTYTIGGITYDDGSNIEEAVGSLVRAAKIERRI